VVSGATGTSGVILSPDVFGTKNLVSKKQILRFAQNDKRESVTMRPVRTISREVPILSESLRDYTPEPSPKMTSMI